MLINPNYLKPLFEETAGQIAMIGAIVFEVIGFFVIRKIVDIKI